MKSVAARLAALWPVLFLAVRRRRRGCRRNRPTPRQPALGGRGQRGDQQDRHRGRPQHHFCPHHATRSSPNFPHPSSLRLSRGAGSRPGEGGEDFRHRRFFSGRFPRAVTGLSWQHDGRTYRAYSNVDFRLLTNVSELETSDSVYTLIFAANLADPTTDKTAAPLLATLPFSPDHADGAWQTPRPTFNGMILPLRRSPPSRPITI